ncbi:MAG: hypothetical protein RL021_1695 [Bacteroidota bacterium]|jgi:hypothetical protein
MTKSELESFLKKSISYAEFRERFEKKVQDIRNGLDKDEKADYYVLNWQRTTRNEKTFRLKETLAQRLENLKAPLTWLVITEAWCGDSGQCLAGIHAIAAASKGQIDLKIFYRDSDTALIDAFLTDGARSIPKLIQLDRQLEVTGTWGPRPAAAQRLVKLLKSDPVTAPDYAEELHKWYAADRSTTLQDEILELLKDR